MSNVRVCMVCKHENPANAAVCAQCGAPLRVSQTIFLSDKTNPESVQKFRGQHVDLAAGSIALHPVGWGQPLIIQIEDGVVLGRFAPDAPLPVVDLTDYRAGLLGVSRQHAVIRPSEEGYTIEDLGSTNGTWINDHQLSPHEPQLLRNGDQIRLGELALFISFSSI